MADLTGTTPADTYKSLLQIGDATNGVDATAKYIEDGEGTDSALAISTDKVGIGTTDPGNFKLKVEGGGLGAEKVTSIVSNSGAGSECLYLGNTTTHEPFIRFNAKNSTKGINWSIGVDDETLTDEKNLFAFKRWNDANVLQDTPFVIDSDGNVGIGTTSPEADLDINGTLLFSTTPTNSEWMLETGADSLAIKEKVGLVWTGRVEFKDGGEVLPGTDDAQDFGSASKRWDDIYATNTTIQTSDRELKQDIEELTEAEERVAVACKGLLRKYRWKSSVEEKGDDARIHFGIMAQDLEAAFAAEGLDAGRYGMFIKNTWWEADRVIPAVEAVEAVEAVYDEEGNEVSPAVEAVEAQPERTERDIFDNIEDAPEGATEVTQRGVRYAELLAFIIAAI